MGSHPDMRTVFMRSSRTISMTGATYVSFFIVFSSEISYSLSGFRHKPASAAPEERETKAAALVRAKLSPRAYVVALCVGGKSIPSEQLAALLERAADAHPSVTFLIGSSYGMDKSLEAAADYCLSLSALTLPHQLARIVLEEQIYRSAMISAGRTYHK